MLLVSAPAAATPGTPVVTDEGPYTRATDHLSATWTASDPGGEILEYEYRLTRQSPSGPALRGWTSVGLAHGANATGLTLLPGESYYFGVRARYGDDRYTPEGDSDGIVADGAAPVVIAVLDDGAFTTDAGALHAAWSGTDIGTGIARYRYAIGTAPGATDVRGWRSTNLATEATASGLTLANGADYYFTVEATDLAGNSSTRSSNGIAVDVSAPVITRIDDGGAYTNLPGVLSASWSAADPGSGVRSYRYSIGRSPGATTVKAWTQVGTNTRVTATGLSLHNGATYYFNVEATDIAGNVAVASADGITSDQVAPDVSVQDDGDVTANASTLHATWSGSDGLSEIAGYEYALGTAADPEALVPWTSRGLHTSVTVTGLTLTDGTSYYFRVKATDGAGNVAVASSDGIRADLSAPVVNAVIDGGAYQASADSLTARWIVSDGGVGIAEYRYAIGTSAGASNVVPWTSAGLDTMVSADGLALRNGVSYYFTVRATDNSGRVGSGSSDGILIDLVAPTLGAVTDAGEYTRDPTSLSFSFSGTDDESGIREYQYAIGTPADLQSVVPWTSSGLLTSRTVTGLHLDEGQLYIVSVYAYDNVGHVAAGYSDGIEADHTAPAIVFLEDDGDVTARTDQLHASWYATDAGAGIADYRYAIGTAPNGSDVVPWTDVGTSTAVTAHGLSLRRGVIYFFNLNAVDGVGLVAAAHSDGIRVDTSAPVIGSIAVDGLTGTTATVHWTTNKPTQGVIDYGTSAGYGIRISESAFGETHAVILNQLTPALTYHYRITASDDAGTPTRTDDLTFTTANEADRHARMSPPGVSYVDPEILQDEAKMTFRLGNGDIWVGDLDPATGGFLTQSGRDYLMDTGSETGQGINGPEFGEDVNGWAVFYSKQDEGSVQVWRSTWNGSGAQTGVLTSGDRHQTALPTRSAQGQTRLLNIIGSWEEGGDIAWFLEGQPGNQHIIDEANGGATNRNPARWLDDGKRIVAVDPASGQLALVNTASDTTTTITNDAGFKTAPQGWAAPEYDGETIVTAVVDNDMIAVYRDLGGRYWTRVATLGVPIESNDGVLSSPEPFVAGDKSYLVLTIKDVPTGQGEATDGEIWVFDLDDDPRTRYAQRCDDGRPPPFVRSDPEVYVGASDVYVYYNAPSGTGNATEMWRCRTGIPVADQHPLLDTALGRVQGVRKGGVDAFLGLPFAAPPVGDLRWRMPTPAAPWANVRQANQYPPPCPQPDPERQYAATIGAEDCLYLNVWTPTDRTPDPSLPVLFFVHGGANRTGSASAPLSDVLDLDDDTPLYDGATLADRSQVIVVTTQYRLAALGNLDRPELAQESPSGTAGNYGMFDLIEALRWVQDNIADFGGNPARVMLFGQSAGAENVGALIASPLAAGLYSRALMESGYMQIDSADEARQDADAFVDEMGLTGAADLPAALRALPVEQIVLAATARPIDYADFTFFPYVDGYLLTQQPIDVVAAGAHNAVPLVIGSNSEEYAHDFHDLSLEDFYSLAAELVAPAQLLQLLALYPLTDFLSPTAAYVAMVTDRNLTCTTRLVARVMSEHQTQPVYRYQFRRELTTDTRRGDGAYHGSELLYVFQHMDGVHFEANADDRSVETLLRSYWTRFATSGDPNNPDSPPWPRYDNADDPYMILDVDARSDSHLQTDRCDFWDTAAQ